MADVTIEPNCLVLALTLNIPTVNTNVVLPNVLPLSLTLQTPSPAFDCVVSVGSAFALVSTQQTPSLLISPVILPTVLSLVSILQTPMVIKNIEITSISALPLTLTLNDPIIVLPTQTIIPNVLSLEVSPQQPFPIVSYAEITPTMQAALIDPYAGGAWLWLAEISIPGYDTIRIARNTVNVIYTGITYTKNNFNIGLAPLIGDGSIPRIILEIAQDASHNLENKINITQGAGGGQVKVIRVNENFLTEAIDELEQTVDVLTAESDSDHIIFSLGIPNPLLRKIPLRRYSSKSCPYASPGLFKGPECQYLGGDNTCTGKYEDCFTKSNIIHWGGELGLDPNTSRI